MTQTDDNAAKASRILWALGLMLLLGGWLAILHVYRWHFTAAVFFLWMGWTGLLVAARFLFRAAMAAAEDTGDIAEDDFWKPVGRHEELLLEKRSLLKAIKEIEFDREMGKMSESDAADLTRFYRQRAIELIKALENDGQADGALSVSAQIEQEVKARLAVVRVKGKASRKAGHQKASDEADRKAGQEAEAKAEAKAGPETEAKADKKAGPEAKKKSGKKAAGQKAVGQKAGGQKAVAQNAAAQEPAPAVGAPAASEQAEPEASPAVEDRS